MPIENLEDQGLEKNPDLDLARYKFLLTITDYKDIENVKTDLLKAIQEHGKNFLYDYMGIVF